MRNRLAAWLYRNGHPGLAYIIATSLVHNLTMSECAEALRRGMCEALEGSQSSAGHVKECVTEMAAAVISVAALSDDHDHSGLVDEY